VNDELETLLANVSRREPASADALARFAADIGVPLPDDYVAFMESSNGGEGEVGSAWIEFWPVERVGNDPETSPPYEGIVLLPGTERTPSMASTASATARSSKATGSD